jgi:hypothetical protein
MSPTSETSDQKHLDIHTTEAPLGSATLLDGLREAIQPFGWQDGSLFDRDNGSDVPSDTEPKSRKISTTDLNAAAPMPSPISPTTTQHSLIEPVCDFFIELFDLNEKSNWLRRQAIIIILQQLLGGTIERYFYPSLT